MKISCESILIALWKKKTYSGTTCKRLKMSNKLNHFCKKINFVAKPEFMAESETTRNASSKGLASFSIETSSWWRIYVFFNTVESIISKWKNTLQWWGLAMLALHFVLSKRNEDTWMQREEEGTRKGSGATLLLGFMP